MLVYPFKGVFYNLDKIKDASKVLTPPYDVISPKMQDEFYSLHPYNIARIILNKHSSSDTKDNNTYTRAAKTLREWLKKEILTEEKEPCFYIYAQQFQHKNETKERLGFIGLGKIDESPKNAVLPHEKTFDAPKLDREKLLETAKINTSCIFCLFQDEQHKIDEILKQNSKQTPLLDAKIDGVRNRLWRVSDSDAIKKIQEVMDSKNIFIADGHHRYEAALNYRNRKKCEDKNYTDDSPCNSIMIYFASLEDKGLTILSTHRLIKDFKGASQEEFLGQIEKFFEVSKLESKEACFAVMEACAETEHAFGMYMDGKFTVLKLKSKNFIKEKSNGKVSEEYLKLDAALFQLVILNEILNVDPSKDPEFISYKREEDVAIELVDKKEFMCAFFLNPTKVHQVRDISLALDRMPQKSTYFYPKLMTGVVMRSLK